MEKLERALAAAELFAFPKDRNFCGPDASITVVAAEVEGQRQRLASWHEPPRDNPLIVIDQRGIYSIKPGEARPQPSPEYARFLNVWSESRRAIESVVPNEGEPVTRLDESVFKLGRARR